MKRRSRRPGPAGRRARQVARNVDDSFAQSGDKPSKSARKREMHARQALGQQLVTLNAAQLARLHGPVGLRILSLIHI